MSINFEIMLINFKIMFIDFEQLRLKKSGTHKLLRNFENLDNQGKMALIAFKSMILCKIYRNLMKFNEIFEFHFS